LHKSGNLAAYETSSMKGFNAKSRCVSTRQGIYLVRHVVSLFIVAMAMLAVPSYAEVAIEEVLVEASSIGLRLGSAGSHSALDATEIRNIGATHVNETLSRVPGVWISRGSGQEHLAGIRSPVFTGSGACGEFSYLEDGVPIRPAGFCNINNLFELNTEAAARIEVWRGPASAELGGNALHGAVNVVTPLPSENSFSVEGGPYDFYRIIASAALDRGDHQFGANLVNTSSNGFRDETGYSQQKLNLSHFTQWRDWSVKNNLTATLLNQETGGFVLGFEAFDDGDLRETNPNPEAFRDAWSLRLNSQLIKGPWTLKPYLRRSQMRFLQHFLPGQPLEENDQSSAGLIGSYQFVRDQWTLDVGGHVEIMRGALSEFQEGPTIGSNFLVETRPAGLHYDYTVDSFMVAGFYNLNVQTSERTRLVHSLRLEHLDYDYDNRHIDGNTRDDGTTCGFGGCLYTRPADRSDNFTNVGARVGIEWDVGENVVYATLSRGFRPPQITELYRLRGGQTIADLDSEALSSFEVGYKSNGLVVAAFAERARDVILRDSDAFNVSDGKTESYGIELEGSLELGAHKLSLATTYAVHKYAFDRLATGFEVIQDGNDVDTAPRWLGNLRWATNVTDSLTSEFELNVVGEHFINAANTADYDGHFVVNWRGQWQMNEKTEVFARVVNLLDERYADRADFAFGNFRYFPALPRQLYAGVRVRLD